MSLLIKNASIVNEGRIFNADVLIRNKRIEKIDKSISISGGTEINAEGLHLFPGAIDDQVHFREPGLTHKGEIFTESRAAVAGGITSYMEMPNTVPNTLTQQLLKDKYDLAARKSAANYSFYMGVSNDNYEEVMRTNKKLVCGLKIFMGSSTGNMLVDDQNVLTKIFSNSEMLIATHCEDEQTIRQNLRAAEEKYGDDIPVELHPQIRSSEACYISSSLAVDLAKKYNTRLHVLHISTKKEIELFDNKLPLSAKNITAEACVHHLWFDNSDYGRLGMKIKWNPAIKSAEDRSAILQAVNEDVIDVIATDHAPHTLEEKSRDYIHAPAGGPLVQHALSAMLELYHNKKITLEKIASKMSHGVATCFRIEDRGFIREGYFADLVLVDLNSPWRVVKENILAKCGWSPFEEQVFNSQVQSTIINGQIVYSGGKIMEPGAGERLTFKA